MNTVYLITSEVPYGFSELRVDLSMCEQCFLDDVMVCSSLDEFNRMKWCDKCTGKQATEISVPVGVSEISAVFTEAIFGTESDGTIKIFENVSDANDYAMSINGDGIDRVSDRLLIRKNCKICTFNQNESTGDLLVDRIVNRIVNRIVDRNVDVNSEPRVEEDLLDLVACKYVPATKYARFVFDKLVKKFSL